MGKPLENMLVIQVSFEAVMASCCNDSQKRWSTAGALNIVHVVGPYCLNGYTLEIPQHDIGETS